MQGNRRKFLKGGAVAATGAAIAGFPMIARAQQTFNWKMTSAYPKGAPFYMDGPGSATDLARRIEAMSNGRLKIQVYGAGELIPAGRLRRGALGHGRDEPCQQLLLDRQDLRRSVLHRRSFWT